MIALGHGGSEVEVERSHDCSAHRTSNDSLLRSLDNVVCRHVTLSHPFQISMTLRLVLPWDGILVPATELDDFVPNDTLIYFNV